MHPGSLHQSTEVARQHLQLSDADLLLDQPDLADALAKRVHAQNRRSLVTKRRKGDFAGQELLRHPEPQWVSEWVAEGIATGKLWKERFISYVASVPDGLREEQFARLSTEDLDHVDQGPIAVVAHDATPDLARRAFDRLREVTRIVAADPTESHARDRAVLGQLQDVLRSISAQTVIAGISDLLDPPVDPHVLEAFTHVFSRVARDHEPFAALEDAHRATVRSFIRNSVELVLDRHDYGGGLKADTASVLSQVGEPRDINDIMRLVQADLDRVRRGLEVLRRGRLTKDSEGARITQASWYVRSIVRLLGDAADDVLLPLFAEPEYQRALLEEYARQLSEPQNREMGGRPDYERIWRLRAQPIQPLDPASRRARFANAIRGRIQQLESTRASTDNERHLNGTLKALGGGLAAVAPRHNADEILALLALPADFDAHTIVQALSQLLFSGATLPADVCLSLLDRPLAAMKKWGIQDHERWTIVGFLRICPFVDDPAAGMKKVRDIFREAHLGLHEVREILPALGNSRSNEALALMVELALPNRNWQYVENEWLEALVALDTDDARHLMLSAIDPALPAPPWKALDWHGSEQLASRIAAMAEADPRLDAQICELTTDATLGESRRAMLARVLQAGATREWTLAALNLIDDAQRSPIPDGVERAVEQAFLEDRPHPAYRGAYTMQPVQSNSVRGRLFSMVFNDERRKRSAYSLLGKIEEQRLEYGRPLDEPRHPDVDSGSPWPPPHAFF